MAENPLQMNFVELNALSIADWIDSMKRAIDKVEKVTGYEMQEATVDISVTPSLSVKFGKKKPPAGRR